jgi:hypothetical protein
MSNAVQFLDAAAQAMSQQAAQSLQVVNKGNEIQQALGVPVDSFEHSEVVLVTVLLDDSSSIHAAGNEQAVREGHNTVIQSLEQSKQKDQVLMMASQLNAGLTYPYSYLREALDLNDTNYKGRGQTPLFDETVKTLASVLAKCQEYASNGIAVRTITLIVTDGADYGSNRSRASDVKSLVQEMLRQENHIIAAMGVSDGNTDFKDVFQGIPRQKYAGLSRSSRSQQYALARAPEALAKPRWAASR